MHLLPLPYKKVIRRGTILTLLLILSTAESTLSGEPKAKSIRNQAKCEPIGRVLTKGDLQLTVGSLLCRGDQFRLPPGVVIDVLCFVNRQVLAFPNGFVSNAVDKCVPPPKDQFRSCPAGKKYCYKPKGPSEESGVALLTKPYGKRLMDGRPVLSWVAVPGAKNFTVTVSGQGVNWQKTVKKTELAYLVEQPAMQPGFTYKITVLALRDNSSAIAHESVVNMITQAQIQQLQTMTKQIEDLELPEDEAAFLDLDAIFMSENLLNATIENLETRVHAGSQNPGIYRVLGDRYLEAGVPTKAKASYQQASLLAQAAANPLEHLRAKAGLAKVARYSQLPIRINPAQ